MGYPDDDGVALKGEYFDVETVYGEYIGGQQFIRAEEDGARWLSRTSTPLAGVRTRGGFDSYPFRQMKVL